MLSRFLKQKKLKPAFAEEYEHFIRGQHILIHTYTYSTWLHVLHNVCSTIHVPIVTLWTHSHKYLHTCSYYTWYLYYLLV
jgi:hypothetical protein